MPRLPLRSLANRSRPLARLSDPDLVAACLSGKADAWDALLQRYEALIFTVSLRSGLSQADAEDIFQDVCLVLLNHLADLRDTTRLAGWLIATTRREAWRLQRRRGAKPASELGEAEWEMEAAIPVGSAGHVTPQEALLALEDQQLVREAMQQLSERCRNLLVLLYCADPPRSYAETAEQLNLPLGSIGPSRARCLQSLQKLLDGMGF